MKKPSRLPRTAARLKTSPKTATIFATQECTAHSMPIVNMVLKSESWPRGRPLRLEGVWVRRGEAEVLRGLDLTFEPDRRYVLVGPSGAGKSTLLRLLNRLEDPAEGLLLLGSTPLAELPVRTVRRAIGLVFQNPRPLPGTVRENLAYPASVYGHPPPEDDRLENALEEVGIDRDWLDRDAEGLSGGERQRLALAVALAAGPEILALDEPTSGLDPDSARRVAAMLARRAGESGLRTIAVTHHREHATWLGDTVVTMDAGRIVDVSPTVEPPSGPDTRVGRGPRPSEVGE